MDYPFMPGWSPELAERGRARFAASGRSFSAAPQFLGDDRPLPPGFSLSGWLKWPYDQGQVGSCFSNMGAAILQLMMLGAVANGAEGTPFNPSRRLIWYQCRKLDGSLGSRSDGGSIVNTFAALGDAPDGIGDCSEEAWPYKPSHSWLEQTPSADVIKQAGQTRIAHIAEASFDATAWKRSIFNLSPIGIGIYWPSGWDTSCDRSGRITGIGGGGYGHALAVIGWVDDWDGHRWWEIENSHGPIYGIPPADVQARIVGYKPSAGDKSFSFWAREDWFQEVLGYRNTETYNAAGVEGFVPRAVNVPPFLDSFPV
jgi:hypothetical protein